MPCGIAIETAIKNRLSEIGQSWILNLCLRHAGFIEPMLARSVSDLPTGNKEWLYEIKLDGYRCLIGKSSNKVTLWSRRGNTFTTQFPLIAQAGNGLEPDTLIDGEIVAIDDDGRVSFNLLQHHRSKAQAIQFYVLIFSFIKAEAIRAWHLRLDGSC